MAELKNQTDETLLQSETGNLEGEGDLEEQETQSTQTQEDLETQENEEERPEWLPPNFKKPEDLVKSYIELEKTYQRTQNELHQLKQNFEQFIQTVPLPSQPQQTQQEPELPDEAKVYLEDEGFKKALDYLVSQKIKPVVEQVLPIQQQTQGLMIEQMKNSLRAKHPDYDTIVNSDEFKSFLRTLPQGIVAIGDSDIDTADWIIREFKRSKNIQSQNNTETVNKGFTQPSKATTKGRQKVWKRSEIIEMIKNDPAKYRRLQKEIIKAYQEGRVVEG